MHLTQWTDYALRVLMYCAVYEGREQPVTISEIADAHGISRSHLTKIVRQLGSLQLLETVRGRGGGMRLMRPPEEIVVGAVVRATETGFDMVECFSADSALCRISSNCNLKGVLERATRSYLAVLDGVTLADLAPVRAPLDSRDGMTQVIPGLPVAAALPVRRVSATRRAPSH